MAVRKHNEFLDGDESDFDDQRSYGSDANEESRATVGGHASKRRKVTKDLADDFEDSEEDVIRDDRFPLPTEDIDKETPEEHEQGAENARSDQTRLPDKDATTERSKRKMAKQLEASQKAVRKSGVIYISRIPPFMKPQTLKHFLEPHAPKGLGRVFLTPEDHAAHARRVKNGGNKKKSFTDGWVEFHSKTEAKIAAETLNGNIIGGKKGNFYHDDLWNIKYLTGFKWNHLTEQIANENAERAARLRDEIRRTREENKAFVEDVERGKMLEGIENKKAKRQKAGAAVSTFQRAPNREFKQQKVRIKDKSAEADAGISAIQKMIFG